MSDPLGSLFNQFVKERVYLKAVTPKTRLWYECAWKAFQASQAADGDGRITRARLQAFVVSLRDRGVKPRSVNTYLQALNAFCRWLHEEGHAAESVRVPLLKTEKRVIATLTEQQITALVSFRPRTFAALRVQALALAVLDTGMRIDEALKLAWKDVDFEDLLLTVHGKGDKGRRIPFSLELRKKLFRYQKVLHAREMKDELAFPGRNGGRWGQRNSLRSLYLLQKRLGLPKFGWHRLRHSFATEYLRAGGEVVRLSRILGHSQVTTTMKYLHLLTEDLQEHHSRLSPLARHQ